MLILRIVRGVQAHFRARASEWALSVMLIGWGYLLGLPRETFALDSFALMKSMASETTWAAAAVLIGVARFLALVINGTFQDTPYSRWSPHVRAGMAFLSCFFWLQITLSLVSGNPGGQGMAIYPVLLLLDLYNAYRSSGDAFHSDEDAKHGRPR